jgi:hypothetical protein
MFTSPVFNAFRRDNTGEQRENCSGGCCRRGFWRILTRPILVVAELNFRKRGTGWFTANYNETRKGELRFLAINLRSNMASEPPSRFSI